MIESPSAREMVSHIRIHYARNSVHSTDPQAASVYLQHIDTTTKSMGSQIRLLVVWWPTHLLHQASPVK